MMLYGAHKKEISGAEPETTNNRMELMAAIKSLEALKHPCEVKLHSDSQYVVNGISDWINKWIANGWKKVKNRDLWERLDAAAGRHEVHWVWVRGHTGVKWNERADKLAEAARLA